MKCGHRSARPKNVNIQWQHAEYDKKAVLKCYFAVMPGAHCVVNGCTNGCYRLRKWKAGICTLHNVNFGLSTLELHTASVTLPSSCLLSRPKKPMLMAEDDGSNWCVLSQSLAEVSRVPAHVHLLDMWHVYRPSIVPMWSSLVQKLHTVCHFTHLYHCIKSHGWIAYVGIG